MKRFQTKLLPLTFGLLIGLGLSSCSEESELNDMSALEDTTEIVASAEIDEMDAVLGDLVIDLYESYEASELGRNAQPAALPDCVTVTLVAEQNFRELTLDFGTEGCEIRGNVLRGKIQASYNRDPEAQQIAINYTLIDFFFNLRSVEATRSILRERSNSDGNPMFTHDLSITVTWPNGATASRQGTKVRTWVEGAGSGIFSDNVFEVTGNWNTTFVNGNSHSYEVLTPLRREVICRYFVSGTFSVERTNFGGTFDFGEGDCDNAAVFTFNNGQEIPITLN